MYHVGCHFYHKEGKGVTPSSIVLASCRRRCKTGLIHFLRVPSLMVKSHPIEAFYCTLCIKNLYITIILFQQCLYTPANFILLYIYILVNLMLDWTSLQYGLMVWESAQHFSQKSQTIERDNSYIAIPAPTDNCTCRKQDKCTSHTIMSL